MELLLKRDYEQRIADLENELLSRNTEIRNLRNEIDGVRR